MESARRARHRGRSAGTLRPGPPDRSPRPRHPARRSARAAVFAALLARPARDRLVHLHALPRPDAVPARLRATLAFTANDRSERDATGRDHPRSALRYAASPQALRERLRRVARALDPRNREA